MRRCMCGADDCQRLCDFPQHVHVVVDEPPPTTRFASVRIRLADLVGFPSVSLKPNDGIVSFIEI